MTGVLSAAEETRADLATGVEVAGAGAVDGAETGVAGSVEAADVRARDWLRSPGVFRCSCRDDGVEGRGSGGVAAV